MQIIYCDWCGEPLPEHYIGEMFGFDFCGDKFCRAFLTIKAGYENPPKPYSSMIPDREQILEAYGTLNNY